MDTLVLMSLGATIAALLVVPFLVYKVIQEEREKKEKLAFVKAFSKRHNNTDCPYCGCLPCQCGS